MPIDGQVDEDETALAPRQVLLEPSPLQFDHDAPTELDPGRSHQGFSKLILRGGAHNPRQKEVLDGDAFQVRELRREYCGASAYREPPPRDYAEPIWKPCAQTARVPARARSTHRPRSSDLTEEERAWRS